MIDDFEPAYSSLARGGELADRARRAVELLRACRLCPRRCGARRLDGELGVCQTGRMAVVGSAFAHHGEEDCLRGSRGSGTIFFAQCNLHCAFCQNADLSHARAGEGLSPEALAAVMLEIERRGCHNVNFVTPSHVVPQILEAVAIAAGQGLSLPLVHNSSGYDTVETLRLLDGVVDVYMPDFKFWRSETARRLSNAPDYPETARAAVAEMHRQVGVLKLGRDGLARRGVLARHLVMPGQVEESSAILEWLARELSPDTYVNVMAQYHPAHRVGAPDSDGRRRFMDIDRTPRSSEIAEAHAAACRAGLWRFDEKRHHLVFI
ncbi:MAG: radical SAM protein [Vicinamibacteria bacterium]|nr:radical SAM protein [Vicinamibacteria bacterium]